MPFPDVSQIAVILAGYVSVQGDLCAVPVEFIGCVRGRLIFDDKSRVHADGEPGSTATPSDQDAACLTGDRRPCGVTDRFCRIG
jgi:hypothetical protein